MVPATASRPLEVLSVSNDVTIRSAIVYVRQVFEQVSLLIQTADSLLAPHGFSKTGARNIADTSATVADPKRLIPGDIFRFYLADDAPRVLLFVCVLLDDRNDQYLPMPECLVTAGAFIHRKEQWDDDWEYWWARWHGFNHPRHDDGSLQREYPSEWNDGKEYSFEELLTVGRPLPEITDTEKLKELLSPLLHALATWRKP